MLRMPTARSIASRATANASGSTSVAFSPDENRLAIGSDQGLLRVWDVTELDPKRGQGEPQEFTGHTGRVCGTRGKFPPGANVSHSMLCLGDRRSHHVPRSSRCRDGSLSFSLFPFRLNCNRHRVFELAIDLD